MKYLKRWLGSFLILFFSPTNVVKNAVNSKFQEMATFPNVTGCVDCTHVPILTSGGLAAEQYRNRKGFFSLKIQVVAGPLSLRYWTLSFTGLDQLMSKEYFQTVV